MPRARKCQRRGIQRGIHRHKAGICFSGGMDNADLVQVESGEKEINILGVLVEKIGRACFYANCSLCFTFCAVRLEKDGDGSLRLCRWWKSVLYYVAYSIMCLSVAHRAFICVQLFKNGTGLDLEVFLCLYGLASSTTALIVGRGVVAQPGVTIDLIKNWDQLLDALKEMKSGQRPSLFQSKARSIQVWMTTFGEVIATLAFPAFSLIFTSLPIFVMPMVENWGWFQGDAWIPKWCWRGVFVLIELPLAGWPCLALGMSSHVILLDVGVMTTFLNELRVLPTSSLESRRRLEQLYIMLQLHNKLFGEFLKPVLVPIYFSTGAAVVICLYFPIRHFELSGIMNVAFVAIGGLVLVVMLWCSMDAVHLILTSEEILSKLQMLPARLHALPRQERMAILKRAKVLRPMAYPMGSFGGFSVEVPVIYSDEIINQLLFLLSF